MPRRSRATRRWNSAVNMRSPRQSRTLVGTSGQASSGHGSIIAFSVWPRSWRLASCLQVGRDVVVEDVLLAGVLVAGVPPPLDPVLSGRGDHRRHQDEQVDRAPGAHQRRREAAERMPHDHEVAPVAHGLHDRVRVVPEACRLVLGRQVRSDDLVTQRLQLGRDQVPVPAAAAAAVDQDIGGHAASVTDLRPSRRRSRAWSPSSGGACPGRSGPSTRRRCSSS